MGSKRVTGRILAGSILIAVGALFLLGTLDVFDIGDILGWFASIVLLAFGVGILIARRFRRVFFPIVLIVIGLFILLGNLGVDALDYWPIILILIGAAIIFGGWRRRSGSREPNTVRISSSSELDIARSSTTTSENEVNISCTFSEADERVETDDFIGGKINATLGNVNLDLRAASVANPPAKLEVSLTMAGLNIRAPSDWVVSIENAVTMGETEDKRSRRDADSDGPHLLITGNVTMGSLIIDD